MWIFLNGLMLGFSLIMALGPQNVFLIRQGAMRKHALLSALVCFLCDVILVSASVMGLNHTLSLYPSLQAWMTWFGVIFLLYYGVNALKKGLARPSTQAVKKLEGSNRLQIIMLALGFSLLNPHAIIDSLVIIGGGSSQFPDHEYVFLIGVLTSSFLWFASLTLTTHYFAATLARTTVWQRIELSSGCLMLFLSLKLAITLL